MRKVLIASAVAVVLFAVGAFAAAFTTVNSEDIASGSNPVTACAPIVDVDFTTVWSDTENDWVAGSAEVTFYSAGTTVATACDNFGASLVVGTTANANCSGATTDASAAEGEDTQITSGVAQIDLTPDLKACAITSAAVLVDGQTLNVPSPGEGLPTP
jgi:hypothetical protein